MTGEILFNHPRSDYDANHADNWSSIKRVGRSPAYYKWVKEHGKEDDTDARKFGRAGHLAILEPEKFDAEVVTWTGGRRAGKEWDAFCVQHEGKEILTQGEADTLRYIRDSVARCSFARSLLTGGHAEVSMFWETEILPGFPVACKGRIDYLTDDAAVDVKLVRDASPEAFGRQALDLGWTGQGAFYTDGLRIVTSRTRPFIFAAAEKQPPYSVAVYVMTPAQLAQGRNDYETYLATLSKCRITGEWPGYATGPVALQLPKWAEREAEEFLNAETAEAAQ